MDWPGQSAHAERDSAEAVEAGGDERKIVVYQSTNREGSTFALRRDAERMLGERFGEKLRALPRIFVAHGGRGDLERLHGRLAKQLVMLLTGLDEEALAGAGDIEFRDPVTDELL